MGARLAVIDAHNHLQFAEFDSDREDVIARARAAGVTGVVVAGYHSARRAEAIRLAARSGICATAGLHPWAVSDDLEAELAFLDEADWSRFAGVGELGLDWVRAPSDDERAAQVRAVRHQLAIARELELPVVCHCVRAHDELIQLLRADGLPKRGGLVHSFWGSAQQAVQFAELGLHLSIGTMLTHAKPKRVFEAIRAVPTELLLVETDAPSRPPLGVAGDRNEPGYLPCVVDALARVLGTTAQAVAETTERSARQLFDLRGSLAQPESTRDDHPA